MDLENFKSITRPSPKLKTLYLIQAGLTIVAWPIILFPLLFKYYTLRYSFSEEGVTMAWGVLFRREIVLTYARIQDIHLSRNILERWLGIGTVEIQTAAGSAGPEMAIVGLTQYNELRDFLYMRMRGARFGDETPGQKKPDEIVALLTEIRDEIRGLGDQLPRDRHV